MEYTLPSHSDTKLIREWVEKSEQMSALDEMALLSENTQKRKTEMLYYIFDRIEPKEKVCNPRGVFGLFLDGIFKANRRY